MTKEQAFEKLELPVGSDLHNIRKKFATMHNDYRMQIDNAFNPTSKRIFEQKLEELKEAYSILNESESMDDNADLPRLSQAYEDSFSTKEGIASSSSFDIDAALSLFGLFKDKDDASIRNTCKQHLDKLNRLYSEAELEEVKNIYGIEIKKAETAFEIINAWLHERDYTPSQIDNANAPEQRTSSKTNILTRVSIILIPLLVIAGSVWWFLSEKTMVQQEAIVVKDSLQRTADTVSMKTVPERQDSVIIQDSKTETKAKQYDVAYDYVEGIAPVQSKGKWGGIDKKKQLVIPIKYDELGYFADGYAEARVGKKWGYIDKSGRETVPIIYDGFPYHVGFSEGATGVRLNEKYGFVDVNGRVIVPIVWDYVLFFSDGLACVVKNEMKGFVDKTGKLVIDTQFEDYNLSGFQNGIAVMKFKGKWGYINKRGDFILPAIYDYASVFDNGMARVKYNNKLFYINMQGECVKDCPE